MNIKNILGIAAAFSVFVTAVSGHPTSSHKKSVYYTAPTGAYQRVNQKVNDTDPYEPPRSPGYNTLTGS
jgi:hypothetical protein